MKPMVSYGAIDRDLERKDRKRRRRGENLQVLLQGLGSLGRGVQGYQAGQRADKQMEMEQKRLDLAMDQATGQAALTKARTGQAERANRPGARKTTGREAGVLAKLRGLQQSSPTPISDLAGLRDLIQGKLSNPDDILFDTAGGESLAELRQLLGELEEPYIQEQLFGGGQAPTGQEDIFGGGQMEAPGTPIGAPGENIDATTDSLAGGAPRGTSGAAEQLAIQNQPGFLPSGGAGATTPQQGPTEPGPGNYPPIPGVDRIEREFAMHMARKAQERAGDPSEQQADMQEFLEQQQLGPAAGGGFPQAPGAAGDLRWGPGGEITSGGLPPQGGGQYPAPAGGGMPGPGGVPGAASPGPGGPSQSPMLPGGPGSVPPGAGPQLPGGGPPGPAGASPVPQLPGQMPGEGAGRFMASLPQGEGATQADQNFLGQLGQLWAVVMNPNSPEPQQIAAWSQLQEYRIQPPYWVSLRLQGQGGAMPA